MTLPNNAKTMGDYWHSTNMITLPRKTVEMALELLPLHYGLTYEEYEKRGSCGVVVSKQDQPQLT